MKLFNRVNKEAENAKLTAKLQQGKLKKEISDKETQLKKLESKVALLESQKEDIQKTCDYYMNLENDREKIEADKKAIRTDREDLEEDKKLLQHKTARLEKREARLAEEQNDEYKKGYSDGLADGLRKAHDITREDRKYMTMIAMSTNQSKAIESSVKALEGGFNDSDTESK